MISSFLCLIVSLCLYGSNFGEDVEIPATIGTRNLPFAIKFYDQYNFQFTRDYFTNNIPSWNSLFQTLNGGSSDFSLRPIKVLEVGCFEGVASIWMLQNYLIHPHSRLTCIDSFAGGAEHEAELTNGLRDRYFHNITPYKAKVDVLQGTTFDSLLNKFVRDQEFDFIYIDAGHTSRNSLEDAILSFPLLR
jgi:hypothetical protein